ncbi:MAG: hypothetical protein HQ541_10040 [Mariniphaga sp.]|nr:hypothetical protein [Mariniphaga sp.]
MEILFGAENSFLYLLVCILIAVGITLLLYFRSKELKELGKMQIGFLFSLRFLSIFFLSILLLSPLIKTLKRYVNNPVILTATDNSASVFAAGDSSEVAENIDNIINNIQSDLKGNFDIVNYTFGENAKISDNRTYNDKKSDYSQLINTVYNNHFNENIGALILVGDGIYNIGANPVSEVQKLNFPIYSIGVGDTNIVKDAAIVDIRVNRNAFVGNRFPVEINLRFDKMPNEPAILQVYNNNEVVYSERIVPANDDYFTTVEFNLESETSGLQHYSVRINTSGQERNIENNKSEYVINVLENKQKILILSEGAHPDLGAIKNVLELQQNFEVSIFTREPYPEILNEFNLIILNQIPSTGTAGRELINKTLESNTPLLFIVGSKTFIPQFNQLNLGVEIIAQARNPEEAQPLVNNNFEIFRMSEELREMIEKFPPLQVPFAEITLAPSYSEMLYQNLNNVKTLRPLIAMGNQEGRKTGVIFGEGLWRWRLYNYYFNESHAQFTEFISSMIQYLSLRENEDNFIIDFKPVYYDTDPVILHGEIYNEAFELINEPEITIDLSDANENKFNFVFDKDGDYYRLDAGKLPTGNYYFNASVIIGDEEFTESGNFTILPLQIENVVTRANFNTLFQIANRTGGELYHSNELSELISLISNNSNISQSNYFQATITELLNLKWLFIVLLLIFSMEWFLRKFWGIY